MTSYDAATRPTSDTATEPGFDQLGLPDDLRRAVADLGYTSATPIQAATIPVLLAGRDVLATAQTGTGKTAAFGLPLLADITPGAGVQALVLTPTRELAIQVADALAGFAAHRDVTVLPIYGGSSFGPQLRGLDEGAEVVVGTPGRIIDLAGRRRLVLDGVRFLVIDEADEMLRMGFAEEVDQIITHLPETRRTALFSATMPKAIARIAKDHLREPERISVDPPSSTTLTVDQTYTIVPLRHRAGALARVLALTEAQATIVFVRTKAGAEELALDLAGRGILAAAISGDVPQRDRERLVERLRGGTLDVLVATDVAARGLDVERIGLVVNFDAPREPESYVHRIGRTGRAGRSGMSLTFFTPRDQHQRRRIERVTGAPMREIQVPTPVEVSAHRARTSLEAAAPRLERGRLELYRDMLTQHAADQDMDMTDLAAALLALAVGDQGPRPEDEIRQEREERAARRRRDDEAGDDAHTSERRGRGKAAGSRRERGDARTYRVAVGHRDGVAPGAIVGAITGEGGLRGSDLGKIEIYPSFSLVEISASLNSETMRRIGAARVAGRALRMRPDQGPNHTGPKASHRPRAARQHA